MTEKTTKTRTIDTEEFIKTVYRLHKEKFYEQRFTFLLGAGASVSSGIPTAGKLAEKWLKEIHNERVPEADNTPLCEEWVHEHLGIESFDPENLAQHYSDIYDCHFGVHHEQGYAALEAAMESAYPSIGYAILAQFLEETKHNVVITTNFDHLTEAALAIYTNTWPQICGHESLTNLTKPKEKRPLIAKIHHDLFLSPKSDSEKVQKLSEPWKKILRSIFTRFTPIVIGYGGNDRGLMDFLNELAQTDIHGGIYWCYRKEDGKPREDICALVEKHEGCFVETHDFDYLMFCLGTQFGFGSPHNEIHEKNQKRADVFREQFNKIQEQSNLLQDKDPQDTALQNAVKENIQRTTGWWHWELLVQQEQNPDKKDALYQQGLKEFPNSPELNVNYALFFRDVHKNYDKAEEHYKRALEIQPDNADLNRRYAIFLHNIRKNIDEAKKHYQKALEIEPENVTLNNNYATFLIIFRKNYKKAEEYYKKALKIQPDNANLNSNYAIFLTNIRKNYNKAEIHYKKTLEIEPDGANSNGAYAVFLKNIRKDYDKAEQYYKKALESEPDHANNNCNYANFLAEIRKDYGKAEEYYKKALEIEPDAADLNGNCAKSLLSQGRLEEAQERVSKAWQHCSDEGQEQLGAELSFYEVVLARLEGKPEEETIALGKLKFLFTEGFERSPWDLSGVLDRMRAEGVSEEEMEFYETLAAAVSDETQVDKLEEFSKWQEVEPVPVS